MSEKISRNETCPCGSGKKYKKCCIDKDFDWVINNDGDICKQIPLSTQSIDLLKKQMEIREKELGRPLRGDDTVFNPDTIPSIDKMAQIMKKANFDPAYIYAFKKTNGLMVTEMNQNKLTNKDLQEWDDAINEYEALNPV